MGTPAAHDDLATRSARFARAIRIRDWPWVEWRWLRNPEDIGTAHVPGPDGRLRGYVAWRRHPVSGKGEIVDLLADDPPTTSVLVRHAADELRRAGADRVLFDVADHRPGMAEAIRSAGFVPRGIGSPVVLHQPPGASPVAPRDWYLTLADTDRA
jgi:hypothetical protein